MNKDIAAKVGSPLAIKILLTGGGTAGSVSPLLAVAGEIKKIEGKAEFLFLGTKKGPELAMAKTAGLKFETIPAGKWRRYFSWANLLAPFLVLFGFIKACYILKNFRADCVFGVGSFVQVPVVWAAWFFRIPVVLHQQDIVPSWANLLCQIPAKKITVTFESSLKDFSSSFGLFYKNRQDKVILTGNPFREELKGKSRETGLNIFGLSPELPVLLVLGGGTGAEFLNKLTVEALPGLVKSLQIIHATGRGKFLSGEQKNYHPFEFISDMGAAYAACDIVLCRGGLSTITELSNLEKVSIIVPIPKSHQELNALMLRGRHAAIVLEQKYLSPEYLVEVIRKLFFQHESQKEMKQNIGKLMPREAAKKIAEVILNLVKN